jgi:hypothetical protein
MVVQNAHHPSDIDGEINEVTSSKRNLAVGGEDTIGNYQPYFLDTDVQRQS